MSTQQLAAPDGLTAHVASEIRAMMGRLNINRAELARRLGVEDSWVGKRLNGRTEISLTDLQKVADALDVEVHDLLPERRRDSESGGNLRKRRFPPLVPEPRPPFDPPLEVRVTGTHPHPGHPVLAGAVPMQRRPPVSGRRTGLTGR